MRLGGRDGAEVLAEHGRWMARLRDEAEVIEQRLRGLERRVNALEANVAELRGIYAKLDIAHAQFSDRIDRIHHRVDSLCELYRGRNRRNT